MAAATGGRACPTLHAKRNRIIPAGSPSPPASVSSTTADPDRLVPRPTWKNTAYAFTCCTFSPPGFACYDAAGAERNRTLVARALSRVRRVAPALRAPPPIVLLARAHRHDEDESWAILPAAAHLPPGASPRQPHHTKERLGRFGRNRQREGAVSRPVLR